MTTRPGPLLAADEQLTHQIADTFARVAQTDRAWTEKIWAMAAARDGSVNMSFGLGKYANRNVMDAFAGISRGTEQWTVRASRRLTPDIETSAVGPITYHIVEPLTRTRYRLAPNDVVPISFDIEVSSVVPPAMEEREIHVSRSRLRHDADVVRFHQAGTACGWVDIDGERTEFDDSGWVGSRDRSWGVRYGVGRPVDDVESAPMPPDTAGMFIWMPITMQRADGKPFTLFVYYQRYQGAGWSTGSARGAIELPDGRSKPFTDVIPEFRFDDANRRFLGGTLRVAMGDRTERTYRIDPVSDTGFHLGAGLYGGFDGHHQGEWRGELHIDGEHLTECDTVEVAHHIHQHRDCIVRVEDLGDGSTGVGSMQTNAVGPHPDMGLTAEASFRVTQGATVPSTIGSVFDRAVADDPTRAALVTRSGHYTYAELDRLADLARDTLWTLGVRPGDRVAVSLPNDTDVVTTFHGAMRLGAVWVGVNRNLAPPEKAWMLDDCGAGLLLAEADTIGQLSGHAAVRTVDIAGEWRGAMRDAPAADPPPIDPFAPAGIAYTSGTTGRPKGVVHTQHNLLLPGAALVASRGYGPSLRKGDCFPMTILNLQVLTTLLVSQAGGCTVLMDRIDAEGVADWIARERVTTWNGPPALLHSLVERDDITAEQLASLSEVWTGGADCPESLRQRFSAKFGLPVLATYGLSEAPTVVTIDGRDGAHRPGASGRPLPHLDVRVLDDAGRPVPSGELGEICVGPTLHGDWAGRYRPTLGYLDRPDATAAMLAGGLLHTGDIGFLDDDGFLHVRDRKNLVILRGGANVYPAEVERVLATAPGVGAGAVYGVPDERLGERVAAVVEPAPGATVDVDAVMAYCTEHLAGYKVPERIDVVDGLPRNAMGKIERTALSRSATKTGAP